jgi:hypothetical protein
MNRRVLWKRLLLGCLLSAILTGCSIDAAETPAAEQTEFPTGRFVDEDSNRAFDFNEDGTWHYFEYNMEVPSVSGKYATNGSLHTEMTHDYSASRSIPVTYCWAYDGSKLTFQLHGEDLIAHRKTCYDGQTYFKTE